MCGRFALHSQPVELARRFGFQRIPRRSGFRRYRARYNIAPSQTILVMIGAAVARCAVAIQWGFEARQRHDSSLLINARVETVADRPTFRDAFRNRRCLIPVDGFYEWRAQQGRRIPYYFQYSPI